MSDNYLQLKSNRFSRYNNFVYIDTTGFLADRIFIENKVRVKFCGDYKHREKNYVVVICKVKEKDVSVFLTLTVAATEKKITMIEAGANEVPDDTMLEAIKAAHEEIKKICKFISDIQKKH